MRDLILKLLMALSVLSSLIVGGLVSADSPAFTYPLALVFASSAAVAMIAYGRLFRGH